MILTRHALNRRTFLRGAGAALALPLLDAMVPALSVAARAQTPQRRIGFVYIPHGVIMDQWTPAGSGPGLQVTPILGPLERFRDSLVVISNLQRAEPNSNHAVSSACWLTGVPPKRTDGPDFRAGTSIDQLIASHLGQDATFPSLELATEDFTGLLGACDPGYSCAYMNTLNWQSPTSPLPMEINPRVVFERMFGGGSTAAERLARMRTDRSILDFVRDEVRTLEPSLGPADRARLGEYLDDVREIERRIARAEAQAHASPDVPPEPVGVPESYEEHVGLMFDLLALAFQADLTRVFTFMLAREVSQRTYPNVGVTEPHHTISHHGNRPAAIAAHTKVNVYHVELFARFIERLRSLPDGDGSVLDHSLIVYGSGMSDGNGHTGGPLPTAVVGRAVNRVKGDRHLVAPERTPMANLHLTLAHACGVELESFGVSTGTLEL